MKKAILMLVVSVSMLFAGAGTTWAKVKTPAAGGKGAKSTSVDGVIKMVNSHIMMLTVPDSNTPVGLNLSTTTTVTINGKQGTIQDLVRGQSVSVSSSGNKVTSVTVTSK